MPITRAQANGTEPMIKIKTKIRKKNPEIHLHLSDSELKCVSEPLLSEPLLCESVFEPLSPCDPRLLPPCTSERITSRVKSKNRLLPVKNDNQRPHSTRLENNQPCEK